MVNRPAAYYQHMIAGEKEAASAQEAETLRPLLANHVAWTSHGAGRNAQIEAPGSLEQLTHTGADDLRHIQIKRDESRGSLVHDSVGMSQMAVHTEDTTVTVGARPANQSERETESGRERQREAERGREREGRALTVLGAQGGEVVLPEHVYRLRTTYMQHLYAESACKISMHMSHILFVRGEPKIKNISEIRANLDQISPGALYHHRLFYGAGTT